MPITDLEVGPGRQHLPDDRRRGRAGRPLQGDVDRRQAGAAGHDRHSCGRPPAAAALELGMGCHREGEGVDGRRRSAPSSRSWRAVPPRRPRDRVRALLEMQRHGGAPNAALLQALVKDRNADVRAAAAYVAGLHSSDAAKAVAAAGAEGRQSAGAAAGRRSPGASGPEADAAPASRRSADIYALLRSADRFVRYSGRVALEHTPRGSSGSRW